MYGHTLIYLHLVKKRKIALTITIFIYIFVMFPPQKILTYIAEYCANLEKLGLCKFSHHQSLSMKSNRFFYI